MSLPARFRSQSRRNNLVPALIEHALLPDFGEREGFAAARAPFGEEDFAVGKDAQFPLPSAIDEGAPRAVSQPAHRPQGADVVWCGVARLDPAIHEPPVSGSYRDRTCRA